MIQLSRAKIGHYDGRDALNVTQKSGTGLGRLFAPGWNMVMGHKNGTISDTSYTKLYRCVYDDAFRQTPGLLAALQKHAAGEHITFTCYCKDGDFCHTHLLMRWLINDFPRAFRYAGVT